MKFKVLNIVVGVLCMLLAAGIMVMCWFEYQSPLMLGLMGVAAVLSLPLCSFFHELGHVLFGAISKINAKISWKSLLTFFKPSDVQIIPRTDKDVKGRLVATAMGGIVINLLLLIFGLLAFEIPQIPTYLAIIAPASFYLFTINVSPFETDSGKTDGLLISELLGGADSAVVTVAVLTVQARILGGQSIKDIDTALLFNLPQIREDDPAFISLCELRAEYFEALGDEEEAKKHRSRLEQLKEDYLN